MCVHRLQSQYSHLKSTDHVLFSKPNDFGKSGTKVYISAKVPSFNDVAQNRTPTSREKKSEREGEYVSLWHQCPEGKKETNTGFDIAVLNKDIG